MSELQMWGNRVLLKRVGQEVVSDVLPSGLIDPNASERQRHNQWEVVSVGDNVREIMLQSGARVIVRAWATEEIRLGDDVFRVAFEHDVIGVVTN
mgnify:CR=1 FL=1